MRGERRRGGCNRQRWAYLAEAHDRGRGAKATCIRPAFDLAIADHITAGTARSLRPTVGGQRPVGPVWSGRWPETTIGNGRRLVINLAHRLRTATPVVDLRRLPRIDARELEQCQSADGILSKLHAPIEHARSRPTWSVLDDEGGPMNAGMHHSLGKQECSTADQRRDQPTY